MGFLPAGLSARQYHGAYFQYELRSRDSLEIELVTFLDCKAGNIPDSQLVIARDSAYNTLFTTYLPKRSSTNVTPSPATYPDQCQNPSTQYRYGIKRILYQKSLSIKNLSVCKIELLFQDSIRVPYKSGVKELLTINAVLDRCIAGGQDISPRISFTPSFILNLSHSAYDPGILDPDHDSFSVSITAVYDGKNFTSLYSSYPPFNCPTIGTCINRNSPPFSLRTDTWGKILGSFSFSRQSGRWEVNQSVLHRTYVAKKIRSYRNGKYTGYIIMDIAYNIATMKYTDLPRISFHDTGMNRVTNDTLDVCANDTSQWTVSTSAFNMQDTVSLDQAMQITGLSMNDLSNYRDSVLFSWAPDSTLIRKKPYHIVYEAKDDGTSSGVRMSNYRTLHIRVLPDTPVSANISGNIHCDTLTWVITRYKGPRKHTVRWYRSDSPVKVNSDTLRMVVEENGSYPVSCKITSGHSCRSFEFDDTAVVNELFAVEITSPDTVCYGAVDSVKARIKGIPGKYSFRWNTMDTSQNIYPEFTSDTLFHLVAVNKNNCRATDTAQVAVLPDPGLKCMPGRLEFCYNDPPDSLDLCNLPGTWKGTAVVQNRFDPSGVNFDSTWFYFTHITRHGCTNHDSVKVQLFHRPDTLRVEYMDSFCVDTGRISLPGFAGLTREKYTGPGVQGGNFFSPSTAGPGDHTLFLKSYDLNGCLWLDTFTLKVHDLPSVSVVSLPGVCRNSGPLSFRKFGTPAGGNWHTRNTQWITNDSFNPALPRGFDSVRLVYRYTESTTGCRNSDSGYLHLMNLPEFDFAGDSLSGEKPFPVQFSLLTPDSIIAQKWIFGDGSASNQLHPRHFYTDTGKFNVTLVAQSGNGCQDTLVKYDYIRVFSNVGMEEPLPWNIRIYPNPVSRTLYLVNNERGSLQVNLYDFAGRKLTHWDLLADARESIDVKGYHPGVYWLEIRGNDHYYRMKLMIIQ